MPKVSVLIPAYNVSECIGRAIESVLMQDYADMEILIIDDGSKDDLKRAIGHYLADGRVRYLPTVNGGVSHAINVGLDAARGEYVCFLHADDLFLKGKIKKQLEIMESDTSFAVSYTNELYFLEGSRGTVESTYYHFTGDIFHFLKRNNFIHMSTVMAKKAIFDKVRLDRNLACHEDWDLFLRLSARGVKFRYIDGILSKICVHPKSLSYNTAVMDRTRAEVGSRAKGLWKEFKEEISLFSPDGISHLGRYLKFKVRAALIRFPQDKKFNPEAPRDILYEKFSA